jgi:hypothetical protein
MRPTAPIHANGDRRRHSTVGILKEDLIHATGTCVRHFLVRLSFQRSTTRFGLSV